MEKSRQEGAILRGRLDADEEAGNEWRSEWKKKYLEETSTNSEMETDGINKKCERQRR